MAEIRFCIDDIDRIVEEIGRRPESLLPILHAIQERYRYLPSAALQRVCEKTDITPATMEGVTTFFKRFRRRPVGNHIISVCDGTACHVKGAPAVFDAFAKELDLGEGLDTDTAGEFTLQRVACLGCCTLAPAVQIDRVTYGHVRAGNVSHVLEDFLAHEADRQHRTVHPGNGKGAPAGEIRVGLGSCCIAGGSDKVRMALEDVLESLDLRVHVKRVSCVGMCHHTPLLEVIRPGRSPYLYAKVHPEDVPDIVTRHFAPRKRTVRIRAKVGKWLDNFYTDERRDVVERHSIDVRDKPVAAFLETQRRLATEYCGAIDPTDLDEYVRLNGFEALRRCLPRATGGRDGENAPLRPDAIIETIQQSGLRGRGGAGFSTARKWEAVRRACGDRKCLVCNGDEGDPGAFMDRMILESYPYRVIEGMLIASLAVGASEGLFYIRAEYPLAVDRVEEAIRKCEEAGYLGDNVLGSGHALRLRVLHAAGAFVCGEETALLASIEGRRGTPAYRPPYPADRGLHGSPTLVNNTETFALVPWIFRHGPEAFADMGTPESKGTKVFSLAGKVQRGGLIEVPMGVTIRQIVEEIGGGVPEGATFKAVQVGGPSGGCIPASLADTPVDYESLTAAGAMMGSGGLVVLDDGDCMVEITRYFLAFTQLESCGKCTPCRVGAKRMLEILTRLCQGEGEAADLEQLAHLAGIVKRHSLCGLGKTAPNPVLTTLRHFRDEFEAHVAGRCPAGKCKALITYSITNDCIGCTKCAQRCPVDAIASQPYQRHDIDAQKCVRCNACYEICPVRAVEVE
ncbi:MAG: 4Fe-4S dicluster domain-containing protein [Nitrospiraceae bacterium]|nr:4Fe-4S dicluster domain-containing protein [Nitrospiraceae bacterium]